MRKVTALDLARSSYVLGLAVITWDQFLVLDVSGFHVKLAYFFLSCSLVLALVQRWRTAPSGQSRLQNAVGFFNPLWRSPWVFWLAFTILCFLLTPLSPVARKSAGYSLWAAFDLVAFAATAIGLFGHDRPGEERWRTRLINGWIAGIVLVSAIAIIDFIAFFFGARGGLIGSLQGRALEWSGGRLPRPHAFSYEPSYLALAICFVAPTLMIRLLLAKSFDKLALGALLVLSVALVLIFSRSGFALLAVETLLVLLFLFRNVSHARKIGFAAALMAVMIGAFFAIPSTQRQAIHRIFFASLLKRTDLSYQGRARVFADGLLLARRNLLGSGPGSAQKRWLDVFAPQTPVTVFRQNQTAMMSAWPEILIEEGVAGLAFVLAFVVALGIALARNGSPEARGVLIAYVAVVGFGMFLMPTIFRADLWSLIAVSASTARGKT